jgi:membrane protease YdiL (CAAX protease family)
MHWLELPAVKWAIPLPLLAIIAPVVWFFFRGTWRELDAEALAVRREQVARGEIDYRPIVALTLTALILTMQEYYGRGDFFEQSIRPWIARRALTHPNGFFNPLVYGELYLRLWWGLTRIGGYLVPLLVWRRFFPRDHLADFGLRGTGFLSHAWIYAMCVVVMVPVLFLASLQPDFANYYPMYKVAGRSWLDFFLWELIYIGQFFTLEIFFRGFLLRAMRAFGAGAIWAMVIPYCMIHFGKPYLEACGAMVAGVVLGSLAMRTRSIYAGFLVHGTVAILMDVLALYRRHALPSLLTPTGSRHLTFLYWSSLFWIAWIAAIVVLAHKIWRRARGRRLTAPASGSTT